MHVISVVSVFNSITKLQLVFFINRNQYDMISCSIDSLTILSEHNVRKQSTLKVVSL